MHNNIRLYNLPRNNNDSKTDKIIHPFDGRVHPLYPKDLNKEACRLARRLNIKDVDHIVGFAEGGLLPTYAVSLATGIPMIGSYRVRLKTHPEIGFIEPHSERAQHWIYGISSGQRIIIIEDEVTTGSTLLNALRSFDEAGVIVQDIGAFIMANTTDSVNLITIKKMGFDIKHLYLYHDFIQSPN